MQSCEIRSDPVRCSERKTVSLGKALIVFGLALGMNIVIGFAIGYSFFWDKHQQQDPNQLRIGSAQREVEANTQDPQAHLKLGYAYLVGKETEKALKEYSEAYRLAPNDMQVSYNLALGYIADKQFAEAIKLLEPLTEKVPMDFSAHFSLGEAYSGKGEYDKAISSLSKAAEIKPGDAYVFYTMALVYKQAGEKEKALAKVNEALRLVPEYQQALKLKSSISGENAGGKLSGP